MIGSTFFRLALSCVAEYGDQSSLLLSSRFLRRVCVFALSGSVDKGTSRGLARPALNLVAVSNTLRAYLIVVSSFLESSRPAVELPCPSPPPSLDWRPQHSLRSVSGVSVSRGGGRKAPARRRWRAGRGVSRWRCRGQWAACRRWQLQPCANTFGRPPAFSAFRFPPSPLFFVVFLRPNCLTIDRHL